MSDLSCPGLSFLLHGPSKAGKSFLANTAPGPRLILDAEGNTRFLKGKKTYWNNTYEAPPVHDGSWDTCIVYIRDYTALSHVYQWLAAGKHPFRSIVIDSLSEVQQRCIDMLAGSEQMKLQQWGELSRKVSELVRQYRDLLVHPSNPLDAIVYTAMTKQNQDGKWFPYVQGQLATSLPYYVDVIGYLKAEIKEDGEFTNFLLTKPHIAYEAGDRTGTFLPVVTNPNIADLLDEFCKGENE